MAAHYRKIDPRIWNDEKFRTLDSLDQLVCFYILTRQSNRIGLFVFSPGLACEDLNLQAERFNQCFRNVCQTFRWGFDDVSRVLYIPTWWRYNAPENGNVLIGNLTDLDDLPDCPSLISKFCANTTYLERDRAETFTQTLRERYPKRIGNVSLQEQEQEQDVLSAGAESATNSSAEANPNPSKPTKARKKPTGDHAELIHHFTGAWEGKHGVKYVMAAKDGVAAANLLKAADGDLSRAVAIVDRFLSCTEPYIVTQRHPLPLLASQINRFTSDAARPSGNRSAVAVREDN